jgi:uncharacterized membrane protein
MIRSQRDHSRWRTSLPLDVLAVSALALFVALAPAAGTFHVFVGLVFVLFAPGYVLLAALFPAHPGSSTDAEPFASTGLTWGERGALSVGTSVAVVPLVALVMAVADASFTASSMRLWLASAVLVGSLIAAARRYTLPPEQRLVVPLTAWLGSLYDDTVGASRRRDAALNVVLAVSILLALASVGFAVADADRQASYAGVALLTENESGDLVAADHPTSYARGETQTYVAQVQNHRLEEQEYTVVTELQRLRTAGDGSAAVVESEVVSRESLALAANETGTVDVSVSPSLVGDDLRLVTFLYEGEAPAEPSMESATEHVFLWVDVAPSGSSAAASSDADADSADDRASDGPEDSSDDADASGDETDADSGDVSDDDADSGADESQATGEESSEDVDDESEEAGEDRSDEGGEGADDEDGKEAGDDGGEADDDESGDADDSTDEDADEDDADDDATDNADDDDSDGGDQDGDDEDGDDDLGGVILGGALTPGRVV